MRTNWPVAAFLALVILSAAGQVAAQKQTGKQKGMVPAAAAPKAPWSLTYHDGSGNGYRFRQAAAKDSARFEYSPIQPHNSSSGVYSGGKPKKGTVSARQAAQLWQWVRKLEADTSLRADSRMMGTGAFRWKEGAGSSGRERNLLVKGGPLLREFDAFLSPFRDRK